MIAEAGLAAESSCSIQVADLSCDHAVIPIAVDHRNPCWVDLRVIATRQPPKRYQILVSGIRFAPPRHRRFVGQRQSGI